MTSTPQEIDRPADVGAAVELLQRADVRTRPLWLGPRAPDEPFAGAEAVLDLAALNLNYIKETDQGLVQLGATTRLQDLAGSQLLRSLAGGILAEAAHISAGSAMRQAASLGGALEYAREAALGSTREGPPELTLALLALDAEIVFHVPGDTRLALPLQSYLESTETISASGLLVEVRFRRPEAGMRGALSRVARTPADQAIVAAAALVTVRQSRLQSARLAVAAGGHAPLRLAELEVRLAGQALTPQLVDEVAHWAEAAVNPRDDFRATAEYRRAMAGVLVRRALVEAGRL